MFRSSGSNVNWTLSNGTVAPATNTTSHPLRFCVNLQNQTVPTFLTGPNFTAVPVCQLPAGLSAVYTAAETTGHTQAFPPTCCEEMQHCGTALLIVKTVCLSDHSRALMFHACGIIALTSKGDPKAWCACLPCQAELAPCEQQSSPA